jgi:two-component system CheB/CheR fusion protein
MVNQELQIELRTILTKVVKHKENLKSDIKRFELFGGEYYVRIHAKPLLFNEGLENLYLVIFEKLDIHDFIAKGSLRDKKEIVDEKIAELEQELVATKEHLQTYIEEIETSNEELQSLNEELQSTNEELQSSNEELETSNEELQSTNEEIQIAYTELKAANEELEKKELLLQELQANSLALLNIELQGLILIDNAYQILQFNNKALEIFGKLSGKNLKRGDTFLEIIPRDNIQQFMDDFSQALKGGNYYGEKQFTAALGQTLWFEVNYIPVIYNNQQVKAIALAFQEITDKHVLFDAMQKTEAKLTENEMLILEAQKVAKMGSWNYDFRTDKLTWSEPLYEVFDVDKETFKQTHGSFVSLVDENDKALVNNTSKKAQETGEPFNIVYRITTPKGEKRVIEEFGFSEKDKTGKIVRLFGTAQNITERNQRDEMLKLFHNVIKQSKDAVNISRIKSKEAISPEIIYVNSAFEKLFGYEKNELLGTDNIQLFGPKSDQTELIKLGEAFKNSEATEVTVICYRKDGSTFWNNISSSPVFSMDG